jgi:hypothetical protein
MLLQRRLRLRLLRRGRVAVRLLLPVGHRPHGHATPNVVRRRCYLTATSIPMHGIVSARYRNRSILLLLPGNVWLREHLLGLLLSTACLCLQHLLHSLRVLHLLCHLGRNLPPTGHNLLHDVRGDRAAASHQAGRRP